MTSSATSRAYSNGPAGVQSQTVSSDSTGIATGTYYYERDPNGTLIAERTPGGDFYYNLDGHGNVTNLLAAADGSTAASYTYDPYGSNASATGTAAAANPWRYASGMLDTNTGLYHYGQRYYNPTLGRWTQQDSIERPGDPNQGNRYAYVGDNPTNGLDPSGKSYSISGCSAVGLGLGIVPGVAAPEVLVADGLFETFVTGASGSLLGESANAFCQGP